MRLLLSNGTEITAAEEVQLGGRSHTTAAPLADALEGVGDEWLTVRREVKRLGVPGREQLWLRAAEVIGVVEELGE